MTSDFDVGVMMAPASHLPTLPYASVQSKASHPGEAVPSRQHDQGRGWLLSWQRV